MTDFPPDDERAVLAALEALDDERGAELGSVAGGDGRGYAELWGLLPFALDPVEPSAGVKSRVMESIRRPEPLAFVAPAAAPAEDRRSAVAVPGAGPARRWLLPLAAAIVAVAVGVSAWLYARVEAQDGEIARLEAALDDSEARAATLAASHGTLEEQLALVATPGMEVCPLNPMEAVTHGARGVVFMDPGGGRWLLRVRDLDPAPEGRLYTLWFMGSDGAAMRGGNLEPMDGDSYQLAAQGMPERMTGIAVTLESDAAAEAPTGPTVLFGDERFSI